MFTPMSTGVRELKLWQEAVALGGEVTRHARQHARRETRAFTDQLVATALAIATSVADGYGRSAATEQRACYRRAKRFLGELETTLAVARHADLVTPTALSQLSVRVATVGRLLSGYLAFIERQVAAEAAVAERGSAAGRSSAAAATDVVAIAPPLSRGD
ncbi:MAG TPA: four helix bundle protein [Gemmatimonadaceae bacterium]|nr:four helix bundle protein [Gemmatimonadaceae bacterium]